MDCPVERRSRTTRPRARLTAATFNPVSDANILMTSGDIAGNLGLVRNNSVSLVNLNSGETAKGIPVPLGCELFTAMVTTPGLNGKDFYDVKGSFGLGTYIAPWGNDGIKHSRPSSPTSG